MNGHKPFVFVQIFKAAAEFLNVMVTVRISYLEIYNEALFDLLAPGLARGCRDTPLAVRDGPQGVYVKGLSIHPVSHEEEALHLLFEARGAKYSMESHGCGCWLREEAEKQERVARTV